MLKLSSVFQRLLPRLEQLNLSHNMISDTENYLEVIRAVPEKKMLRVVDSSSCLFHRNALHG